jgi:integrase
VLLTSAAIYQTAVEDGLVLKNPCVLRGASVERPAERPIATIAQVFELADAIEESLGAMVLLATFTGPRLGELRALRCNRIDLLHRRLMVVEQLQQLKDGTTVVGPPKSDAGLRTVSIPNAIIPDLERHLARFGSPGTEGLVFAGSRGQPVRLATFYASWHSATRAVGLAGFHFHDLRHTGNTMAAATGASTKELMSRRTNIEPTEPLLRNWMSLRTHPMNPHPTLTKGGSGAGPSGGHMTTTNHQAARGEERCKVHRQGVHSTPQSGERSAFVDTRLAIDREQFRRALSVKRIVFSHVRNSMA